MPTQISPAEAVAQLATRIEQRRAADWLPEPGSGAKERRRHWQEIAAQHVRRIEAGEFIDDTALAQLRSDAVMTRLGREFLKAAERGSAVVIGAFLEEGFPANWQDNRTKETALHVAAASRARGVLRILLEAGQCDYLLRDKGGRLASDLAYLYGHDPSAARLLGIKERKQAEAQGTGLSRRPVSPSS